MWIHLLTLGLIDGAGGEPRPSTATVSGVRGSTKRTRRPIVVVEVDGVEYRILLENLDEFLKSKKKEAKQEAKKLVQSVESYEVEPPFPPIIIRQVEEAPPDKIEKVVNSANQAINDIWQGVLRSQITQKLKRRQDDEEALLILLMS